jgi:nucleotide-binding universal stress UspA family protein
MPESVKVFMYSKILVPLDGSELSERALKPAFALAEKFGAEIILLRITLPEETLVRVPAMMPSFEYGARAPAPRQSMAEAEAYLDDIKLRQSASSVSTQTQVMMGPPPEIIVATAREQQVDLIVMSTHGRSGISRLVYGSVAEAVLRGSPVPVLLIPDKI